ncbi:hypothetical protein [Paenibacillus gallinarum]|uniref:Uncharacterized protein n=1 Tax=Paenibacillus gallinarum TaxID=2762232 RepID=A0ABR8T3D8_9BACL|nr:hypothetical protein [Paenibacillus gallinarum]MBD7970271.1 hypothetical protein [Paenibacillus gallinarum]
MNTQIAKSLKYDDIREDGTVQLCVQCAKLTISPGAVGICSVKGCTNEAEFYEKL